MRGRSRSSRREEERIAQDEILGKRPTERFPPRRGGVMCALNGEIPR